MNELSSSVLKAMESSSLGRMSIYVLSKQGMDLGIDVNNMEPGDLPKVTARLKTVLPFFLGDETDEVITQIRRLNDNNSAVKT